MNKIVNNLIGYGEEYISYVGIDLIKEEVKIGIKNIFRPGSNNCEFGFEVDRSIEEGALIITDVKKVFFDSQGTLPNDLEKLEVIPIENNLYKLIFYACDYDKKNHTPIPVIFTIIGENAYLIDMKDPDKKIIE
ncbi:MAG: hypothetical protein KH054_10715 [Firmicutes bacterium]|nr:hypothetical protein [Bacillota bacterium]